MQTISQETLADVMYYNDIPVLTYTINYPRFTTTCSATTAQRINRYYTFHSKSKELYCRKVIYPQAIEHVRYVQDKDFPFHSYEYISNYQITYNENCIISLYMDQYSYTGGAHGNTLRQSNTWDFQTGRQLYLSDFFSNNTNFTKEIFKGIEEQITQQLKDSPAMYFDDYPSLIRGNFDINSFYLTPEGIILYYQQYDIAPYVRGIPEFLFPFNKQAESL